MAPSRLPMLQYVWSLRGWSHCLMNDVGVWAAISIWSSVTVHGWRLFSSEVLWFWNCRLYVLWRTLSTTGNGENSFEILSFYWNSTMYHSVMMLSACHETSDEMWTRWVDLGECMAFSEVVLIVNWQLMCNSDVWKLIVLGWHLLAILKLWRICVSKLT